MTKLEKLTRQDYVQLALCLLFFLTILFGPYQDLINYSQVGENLYAAIQFKYNFYFYLTSVGTFLASGYGNKVLLLFGICCSYLILSRIYSDSIRTLGATLAGWLMVLQIFKLDYSVLATLCFGAVFFMSLVALRNFRSATISLFIVLCISAWVCLFNFALLSLLLGLGLYMILGKRTESEPAKEFPLYSKILVSTAFTLLFAANSTSPELPFLDYPATARLTQIFDAPGWYARPLIGPDNPLPIADRLSLREDLGRLILPCFIGILILLMRTRNFSRILLLCGFLILLYCDLRLPENYSQILPLQGLARMLPGITDMALVPILSACIIFALTFLITLNFELGIYLFTAFTVLIWITGPKTVQNCPEQFYGTPSCFAARFFPAETLSTGSLELKKIKPKKDSLIMESSAADSIATDLVDRNPLSRWSPGNSRQSGGEWFQLAFDSPQQAVGIELQTGNYSTDFPRGLEVYAGQNCQELKLVAAYSNWQGALLFTEKGFPYFGQQADVRVLFNNGKENFSCLKVIQTARNDNFDWSVAEFRLLVPKSAETTEEE